MKAFRRFLGRFGRTSRRLHRIEVELEESYQILSNRIEWCWREVDDLAESYERLLEEVGGLDARLNDVELQVTGRIGGADSEWAWDVYSSDLEQQYLDAVAYDEQRAREQQARAEQEEYIDVALLERA
jgi:DNA repair exonuclease SbcCD ATPase subunit